MSKSYHYNDTYAHQPQNTKNQFSVKVYFERFDRLIDEEKYNKNTDIKNIFHMLEEVQPHFGDTSFECFYFLKLINEIEKLKKRCPVFAAELDIFLHNNQNFIPSFIQYSFNTIDKFYKKKLFTFLLTISHFPIVFTKDQKECIYQAMYFHIYSFEGINFCDSLDIITALKEPPTISWQKEWMNAFLEHKNEIDPAMLAYIADRIHIFDSGITHELTKKSTPYKTPLENKSQSAEKNASPTLCSTEINDVKPEKIEKNGPIIKQKPQTNKIIEPKDIIHGLKVFAHITGEIPEGKINFFNRHLKKCFPDLSQREIIQILYYYSLLHIDKDHALPVLKRAKAYFDSSKTLFTDINESEFRKLIIAKRYFDVLGFPINITHHTNFEGYLTNLKKWVIKKRTESDAQKYVRKIVKPYLMDIESESYLDIAGDCVDLFSPSSNLVIEVDGEKFHTLNNKDINPKTNLITRLKSFLIEKHGVNLIRLNAEKIKNEGRSYILNKINPFIRYELELLQNDYIQELYENGGKYSYDIIETNEEPRSGFLNCLLPFTHTYRPDNPDHQNAMSTWMTSLLKNVKCPTCSVGQFTNHLADLNKLIHLNATMKEATSEYFKENSFFLKEVVARGNVFFDQFNFCDFQSFLDYGIKIQLPFNEEILRNWCIYVAPMLHEAETEELENILKFFVLLNFKPSSEFADAFFKSIKNKLPAMHVQNTINLLSHFTFLNLNPPAHLNEDVLKHFTPRLKYLHTHSLFSFPKNISVKGILNHESFAQEWFSLSAQNMPHVNIDILINSTLYSLYKFENSIPDFWLKAFSQKILNNLDALKIYNIAHLLQGLSYTFVHPKRIEDLLHACQDFIIQHDAPTFDKISISDLNKIIPAMNYFKLGGVNLSLDTEKYHDKVQKLLMADDKNKECNALLAEYVKEYFEEVEQNKPFEQILKSVDLYINSHNLIIFIFNEKHKLRSRLNVEILKSNKYNLILLNKDKLEKLGKDYIDIEIKKYLNNKRGIV